MPPTWIDSHAHLDAAQFAGEVPLVVERARAAGVTDVVDIGTDVDSSRAVVALAEAHAGLWAVIGVHPHHAQRFDALAPAALTELAAHPRVVGYGEIGLDYHYDFCPRDVQREAFARQLELAAALSLPIVIHCREAMADTLAVLDAHGPRHAGVFHCFAGDADEARAVVARGFHVSFTGPITYPKGEDRRAAARAVPLDRLLVETDCPYLSPIPHRGKRNEPAFVVHTARALAQVHGLTEEELSRVTRANTLALFTRMGGEVDG